MRANIAAYHSKIGNVQRATLLVAPDGSPYTSVFNAAKARVQGVELEANVRPFDGLTLEGSVGVTDAKYNEFLDPRPGVGRGRDISFLKYPNTPKVTYNFAASYVMDLSDLGQLNTRIDYAHRSTTNFDIFNDPRTVQKPYGLLNARMQFNFAHAPLGQDLSIAAYGRNLTNEKYSTYGSTAAGGVLVRSVDRRSYGAELKVTF